MTGRHDFNPPAPCGAGHCNRPLPRYGGKISIHPPRAGRDQGHSHKDMAHICIFQSTRPVRGGTCFRHLLCHLFLYFNPPAPCGAGPTNKQNTHSQQKFQSTRPVRGGTLPGTGFSTAILDFNPPAPCGAGRRGTIRLQASCHFNPPAPCGAGLCHLLSAFMVQKFQSTRPVRGGTLRRRHFSVQVVEFQSTRPVRGGTYGDSIPCSQRVISIHPPRAGRDAEVLRVATLMRTISIHPPRAGRDDSDILFGAQCLISIHPPRAGRDSGKPTCSATLSLFQSTRPVRGGTRRIGESHLGIVISIHPPRAGRDDVVF